jgi:hypothetical protein
MISPKSINIPTLGSTRPEDLLLKVNSLIKRFDEAYRMLREDVSRVATISASGITPTDITNWNTAYGWGNHASAGYLTEVPDETDPVFVASAAKDITVGDTNRLYFMVGGITYYVEGTVYEESTGLTGQPIGAGLFMPTYSS